jgi:hypothetical protein
MNTEINVNIMTPKQIRALIKEVILEATNAIISTKTGTKTIPYKNTSELTALKSDPNVRSIETTGGQKIKEMARKAKGYQIIDSEFDTTPYATKTVSGISIASIIDYIKENPGVEKKDIQTQFNFIRPQIANALINGLKDAGIIAKMGEIEVDDETGEVTVTDEEPVATTRLDAEDFFVGNRKGSFFNTSKPEISDEDEMDIPEEPEIPELPANRPSIGGLSDEDYNAWMEYSKFKERLARTKSALIQTKKMGRGRDDISLGSDEIERLQNLKISLEQRIQNIINSNEYVKNKIEQERLPDEDKINESIKKRLQQLANI